MTANPFRGSPSATVPTSFPSRPRRRSEEGSIRRLASGRWQARLPARLGGGSIGTYVSAAEAQRALRRAISMEGDPLTGLAQPSGTVADLVAAYLHARWPNLATTTRTTYRAHLDRRIRRYSLGQIRVAALTPADVDCWQQMLAADGFAATTRDAAQALLKQAFDWAVRLTHLSLNPAAAVVPTLARPRASPGAHGMGPTREIPDEATVARVIAAIPGRADRLLALVLAWAGLRMSEAAALSFDGSVHPTRPALVIDRRVAITGRAPQWWVDPHRPRQVPIPTPLWLALLVHRRAIDSSTPTPSRGLFSAPPAPGCNDAPGPWTSAHWARAVWRRAVSTVCAEAPAARTLRTLATYRFLAAGATLAETAMYLGHTSIDITAGYYRSSVHATYRNLAVTAEAHYGQPVQERLNSMWAQWVERYGDPLTGSS
ncbi:tyrosine-type recombinase/integrase [Geodermatophilus sp. SYSU D01180]